MQDLVPATLCLLIRQFIPDTDRQRSRGEEGESREAFSNVIQVFNGGIGGGITRNAGRYTENKLCDAAGRGLPKVYFFSLRPDRI